MAVESHTLWSDRKLEDEVLQAISLDLPWSVVERFAGLTRLSGSKDEAEAMDLIQGHLSKLGIPHTLHKPVTYISIPLEATVRELGGEGRSFRAKTSAMSVSTNGDELEGELLYVGAAQSDTPGDVISATVDMSGVDGTGKIIVTEGLPFPGIVDAVTKSGAVAGIFVAPGKNIHETICTPIWGSPDLSNADRRPKLPVIAVNRIDGDELVEQAKEGARVAVSTRLDTGWREIPVLVAEIPGQTFPDEFVLLHGHLDSWHVGIGDNATGDATMLELARVFWAFRDQLKRSLRVAWWSGHSHGRYAGSTWYADTFAGELAEGCVAQVNCDSPGCRWATTFNELTAMTETYPLITDVIGSVASIVPEPERPPRAGDYSFNGIGISSYFMLSSTMSDADREAHDYYPVGGCGGNIAWHTEDDVMEIADKENLLRDMRVYGAAVLRTLNAPVHPVDWRLTSAEIGETLDRYAAAAQGVFDFAAARKSVAKLDTALDALYARAGQSDLNDDDLRAINRAQRRIARFLIPVNFSRMPAFWHDPALNVPPLPDLHPALRAPELEGDLEGTMLLKNSLQRGQNRFVWMTNLAAEAAELGAGS